MFISTGRNVNIPSGAMLSKVKAGQKKANSVDIPCYPLIDMLKEVGNPIVDYFSLDIEGFEMKVNGICGALSLNIEQSKTVNTQYDI